MAMSRDWISDGLTRIRNAVMLNKATVEIRGTKSMLKILDIMQEEGFIKGYEMVKLAEASASALKQACSVKLLYRESRSVIQGVRRI